MRAPCGPSSARSATGDPSPRGQRGGRPSGRVGRCAGRPPRPTGSRGPRSQGFGAELATYSAMMRSLPTLITASPLHRLSPRPASARGAGVIASTPQRLLHVSLKSAAARCAAPRFEFVKLDLGNRWHGQPVAGNEFTASSTSPPRRRPLLARTRTPTSTPTWSVLHPRGAAPARCRTWSMPRELGLRRQPALPFSTTTTSTTRCRSTPPPRRPTS